MSRMRLRVTMTEAEFLARVDTKPYFDFWDTVAEVRPAFRWSESATLSRLSGMLYDYVKQSGGQAGVMPHIDFCHEAGRPIYLLADYAAAIPRGRRPSGWLMRPPTLAADVRRADEGYREKCRFMREHGVDECWLIDPEARTVEVYDEQGERTLGAEATLTSAHLPGFELALGELFAALD